jgi:hypothetical protein
MAKTVAGALVFIGVFFAATERVREPGSGSQAVAISTLRALHASQLVYSTNHRGLFNALTPLAPEMQPRRGYRFEFYPGPGLTQYAVVAIPIPSRGAPLRSFCVDDTGVIFFVKNGTAQLTEAGRCRGGNPIQ